MVEALLVRGVAEHLYVAVLEGEAVAYVLYTRGALSSDPEARVLGLTIMGVAPPLQRRGIGTRLLDWSARKLEGCLGRAVRRRPSRFFTPVPAS
jgi:GNAT superfamily N-acetyltransferase